MKEGFWSVAYESAMGVGFGVLTLDTGIVVGADAFGGIWDGTYKFNPRTEMLDVHLTVTFPPGVVSAVSGDVSSDGHQETSDFSLPNQLEREHVVQVTLRDQPLEIRVRKIRDFP